MTLGRWLADGLGYDPRDGMTTARWLATPQQSLLHVTAGPVFHDEPGELTTVREVLAWYPRDVWLWIMASGWQRVQDLEHVAGRTGETGDDLGNRVVIARLVRHLMSLCFLQERCYAPYPEWFGLAFGRLEAAGELTAALEEAVAAPDGTARLDALARSLETVARRHNGLAVTEPLGTSTGPFDVKIAGAVRPFRVLNANRYVRACIAAVEDAALRDLAPVGAIDGLLNSNDLIANFTDWPRDVEGIYAAKLDR